MMTENSRAADEACIRELIEERVGAIRAKDIDALMGNQAPDVVMFDALDPLRYVGSEAIRERAGQWLSWYEGPVGYEVRDLDACYQQKPKTLMIIPPPLTVTIRLPHTWHS